MTAAGIPDSAERERALDTSRSFIVQAPAGSGKTELLIQRYLALLAAVESPEEVVAITFTIKAAGEMRGRVLAALAHARAGKVPGGPHEARTLTLARAVVERDRREGWRIDEHPVRLRIQTIDALCAALARQMPVLSRFGAAPETIEDASAMYLEAARGAVALLESGGEVAADIECLLAHLDNDAARLEWLLAGMLQRRDQWIRHVVRIGDGALDRAQLEAALAHERERLVARAAALYPGAPPGAPDAWRALAQSLLTKETTWRKKSPEAQALAGLPQAEPLREAFAVLCELPPAAYTDAQWRVIAAIGNLLKHATATLRLVFAAHGQVDFTEVAQAALHALGEDDAPTDLALALDYRVRHLLVDEFQDTSITQYELIGKLTAGWQPGDGRTLFAVGDPMQSIYRFREAEVGEFLRTWTSRQLGAVALERVRLSANFRSQAGIVDWINAAFAPMMPAHEEAAAGAVPYAPSAAVHPPLPGSAVEVHPFFDSDDEGEAARVVELVASLRRHAPDATVAVLVRNRNHLERIVPRFRAAGLRFRAIEIEQLGLRPVVQDLLALTRAAAHPADRLAWLAVLRAPWCGLELADLCALAEGTAGRTVWELMTDAARIANLSAGGRARLEQTGAVLGEFTAGRFRGSLRDRVEGAWLALGGPACVDDTALEDAAAYLDVLEEAEVAGAIDDRAWFEARVSALWALPDVHAGATDVQIMTIHKAKGLEFDHVIVPGLGRPPRGEDARLFLWTERESGGGGELLVAPIAEAGVDADPVYERLAQIDAEREDHEAARLLYVAATRARERLHLLGDVKRDEPGRAAPRAPGARTLLAKLWPAVARRFEDVAAVTASVATGAPPAPAPLQQDVARLAAGWRPPEPPPGPAWGAPPAPAHALEAIQYSWVGETARHVGSVVHRWLQHLADDRLEGWDEARVERLRSSVRSELAVRGVRAVELDGATRRALSALRAAIADPRGRWVLGPHPYAATEHRLTAVVDGAVQRLVIDRLFDMGPGERWIVDYKTSTHEGADPEGFLDQERARYAAQLERYAKALGGTSRLGLYFPLLSGWREI
ncbi:MAG TPA: UvrD-helicase domain-containing protein [Burkholderiales bacterium]|nr:UvrD-helicase domain-containing protein [Burkholderiales bacterium]